MPTLGRYKQEEQESRVVFNLTVSLRLAWAICNPVSKTNNKQQTEVEDLWLMSMPLKQ